jgi:hypothetical protein
MTTTTQTAPMLTAALDYHAAGICVIPCKHADKHPLIKWEGFTKERPKEKQIRTWFGKGKKNIAFICGAVSGGLIVLDFDEPGLYYAWAAANPELAKAAPTVKTGRGFQVYLRMATPCRNKKAAPKVDVRGEGGYVVAPPSIHPTGAIYEFVNGDLRAIPLIENLESAGFPKPSAAPAPAPLPTPAPLPSQRDLSPYAAAAIRAEIAAVKSALAGDRNNQLNRSAFALGTLVGAKACDRSDFELDLVAAALGTGLSAKEVYATVKSGIEDGIEEPRTLPKNGAPAPAPAPVATSAPSVADNPPEAPPDTAEEQINGDEFQLLGLLKAADDATNDAQQIELVEQAAAILAKRSEAAVMRYAGRFYKLGYHANAYARLIRLARQRAGGESFVSVVAGQLCWLREPLMNLVARITHELLLNDGQEQPRIILTISGIFPTGEPLPDLKVPAEDFESCKWLTQWGPRVVAYKPPSQRYMIARAIQEYSMGALKRETVYTCTGWTMIGADRCFLTAGGAITAEGHNPEVRVDLGEGRMSFYHLPPPPEDARQPVRESIALLGIGPINVTAPIWAVNHAAVLGDNIPFNSMLWADGSTGSRKTAYTFLVQTHYGPKWIKGHETFPVASWFHSIPALEPIWHAVKDLPLIIDNYKPSSDRQEAQKQAKAVEVTLHLLGDRAIRGRAHQHGGTNRKAMPPRGVLISTSELPFPGESNTRRMFSVGFKRNDIDNGKLTVAQGKGEAGVYAQASAAFIQWRLKNWDKCLTLMRADKENAIRECKRAKLEDGRILDYTVVLLTAASLFLEFALDIGAIDGHERSTHLGRIQPAIIGLALQQQRRADDQTPLKKLAEAIVAGYEQQTGLILPRTGAYIKANNQKVLGFYQTEKDGRNHLYLLPAVCVAFAIEHWAALGQSLVVTADVMGRDLEQGALLLTRTKASYQSSKFCGGGTKWVLDIDADLLLKTTGVDLWPPRLETNPDPEDK